MLFRSDLSYRQLHSNRPPLQDVPVIYFITPTLSNIRRVAEDLKTGLYEKFHISFVEPLPRALLEEFAAAVANDDTLELIDEVSTFSRRYQENSINFMQVVDQYLSFITPSPSLFSLLPLQPTNSTVTTSPQPQSPIQPPTPQFSYTLLNSPSTSDSAIEEETERIANGLFSVVATMGGSMSNN